MSFRLIIFDETIHKSEFKKYGIYEKFPDEDIDKINSAVLDYFKYEEKNIAISNDFFNEKEKTHLIDVKLLVRLALFSLYIGLLMLFLKFLLLVILVRYQKEDLLNYSSFMLAVSGILTIIPTLLLLFVMKINFNLAFTFFHLISFNNDLWLLDPAVDSLVVIYPEGFFYDMAIKIVLAALIQALALVIIGISLYKIRKRFKNKETISKKII